MRGKALLAAASVAASVAAAASEGGFDPSLLSQMKWRCIGPFRGGRSLTAAGSAQRPLEYYFGAVGGGLWKTTDGGVNWEPVTDGKLRSSSVGAVAVAPSNPDIVYIGMGEAQLRGNVMQGDGVYRSSDAGRTWTHLGLPDTHAIARIRVHPTNPDVAYVAALGHPYGPNAERGVFRTADAGRTWTRVLFRSERAGAVDLAMDAADPRVLYATLWEVYRKPWTLSSGGPGSGLFKTTDGGETWTELTRTPGLPAGVLGKIGVTVSPADPRRVWALIEAEDGGLFRSDDGGDTWMRTSEDRDLWQRAFYFTRLQADPIDRDTLYVLNVFFHKSTDGGRRFSMIDVPHADQHDLWIDPRDPERMINSNDGGAMVSTNGGRSWTAQSFPTAQMYHVATTRDFPYHVCGAQQDNSTACVPSDAARQSRDPRAKAGLWLYGVGGNESGHVVPHPTDPNIFYSGGQEAYLTRYDRRTGFARDIQPWPRLYSGESAGSVPERWNWTFPIAAPATQPGIVYVGSQHLWRTRNDGQSWEKISPDLTHADPQTLGDSGGPITKDQNGPEFFATIFTIAPSRLEKDTVWVGSDDGVISLTRDGGRTWTKVTPRDMPEFTTVSLIEASPHRPGAAYVAGKRYRLDDRAPHAWKTEDYGQTWTRIVNGLAATHYVHAVREDPARPGLLFAGTEHGPYVSFDDGLRWHPLSLNLPDTQVSDLVVEGTDLVIATHGRSFWVMDDLEPIRQWTDAVRGAPLHLFRPRPAIRREHPALVDFWLSEAGKVRVEVLDGAGNLVRTVVMDGAGKAGLNRVSWDLRYPGAVVFEGLVLRSADAARGPLSPPGKYQVRVSAGGQTQTQSLTLLKDPRLPTVTQADLEEQFRLAMKVRDATSTAHKAVMQIRAAKTEIEARRSRGRLRPRDDELVEKLSAIEEALYQVKNRSIKDVLAFPIRLNNRLAALQRVIEEGDARPTDQTYKVLAELSAELSRHLASLSALIARDLSRLDLAPDRPEAAASALSS